MQPWHTPGFSTRTVTEEAEEKCACKAAIHTPYANIPKPSSKKKRSSLQFLQKRNNSIFLVQCKKNRIIKIQERASKRAQQVKKVLATKVSHSQSDPYNLHKGGRRNQHHEQIFWLPKAYHGRCSYVPCIHGNNKSFFFFFLRKCKSL